MPLWSLKWRRRAARLLLAFAILIAAYIAIPHDEETDKVMKEAGLRGRHFAFVLDDLSSSEAMHILAHSGVFALVALLLGEWGPPGNRGSTRLALHDVVLGGLLMEAAQMVVGWWDDSPWQLLQGSLFDMAVNLLAALLGLWLARHFDQWQGKRRAQALKRLQKTAEPSGKSANSP